MKTYFETYETTRSGDALAEDGIDLKGSCTATAHETLEDAIAYADAHGCTLIAEIGGSWNEYEKCAFCGEWFDSCELNTEGDCERCEIAIRDHNGLW